LLPYPIGTVSVLSSFWFDFNSVICGIVFHFIKCQLWPPSSSCHIIKTQSKWIAKLRRDFVIQLFVLRSWLFVEWFFSCVWLFYRRQSQSVLRWKKRSKIAKCENLFEN
jgi:hypothetical protein